MRHAWLAVVVFAGISCKQGAGGKTEINQQLVCDSNATGTLSDATIKATAEQVKEWGGSAFEASGNCDATLINVDITSPAVAIRAGGNTKLVLEGGRIEGAEAALDLSGNAQVELKGATIVGEIVKSGNAKVIGESAPPAAAPTAADKKGGEDKKGGDDTKAAGGKKAEDKKGEGGW